MKVTCLRIVTTTMIKTTIILLTGITIKNNSNNLNSESNIETNMPPPKTKNSKKQFENKSMTVNNVKRVMNSQK